MGLVQIIDPEAAAIPILAGPERVPKISSLLVKPNSTLCDMDCVGCYYTDDRPRDPFAETKEGDRRMDNDTLAAMVRGYMIYAHPSPTFAFQGGEPLLMGIPFYERFMELVGEYAHRNDAISLIMQTNGRAISDEWCERVFKPGKWLLGVSLNGEAQDNASRLSRGGESTFLDVVCGIQKLQSHNIPFTVLCVVSARNVRHATEIYRFFRSIGVEHMQFIPQAEFDEEGAPHPFSVEPKQYGEFMNGIFHAWMADRSRRRVFIRNFETIMEALAGLQPSICTMHESCYSYVVVEYDGSVYPCDFYVEPGQSLGNVNWNSFEEIGRSQGRLRFAGKKQALPEKCQACKYRTICRGGCPDLRRKQFGFDGAVDYFCEGYLAIFDEVVGPLASEVRSRCPHLASAAPMV